MNAVRRPAIPGAHSLVSSSLHYSRWLAACSVIALAAGLTLSDAATAAPRNGSAPQASGEAWAKGRILVMPRAGLPESQLTKILQPHGGKAHKIGQSSLYIVELPAAASEKAVAALLSRNPHLKFAELDRRVVRHYVANDPYMGSEWHLAKIGATAAWDTTEGAGITVAILDTGVDGTHPDLKDQMVAGWNTYDGNSNSSDVHGHGTAVAGSAAAVTNNATGVASVAGKAKIMPIRVTDLEGYGYISSISKGLIHAADQGARVANVSFGVAGSSSVQSAANYMKGKGGLVVVSAGNNGTDENITPTTTLIPVSATSSSDTRTSWSSYGNFVAMSAPGAGIYSTNRGGGYGSWNGTSFSSPVTAGVIALMMSARPLMTNTDIESLLYSTAVDLGTVGRDPYYGYGRVNASGAVQAVVNATSTSDTQAPTASIAAPLADSTVSGLVPVDVTASDNVGVARMELQVNGSTVAVDSDAPFSFSWDSTGVADGMASLKAVAFDAASNQGSSALVSVNVANSTPTIQADTEAPSVTITNPVAGKISGNVSVSVSASDNAGSSGITQYLYINGVLKAKATGSSLGYNWNTRKIKAGTYILDAIATDAAGNKNKFSVQVTK